MARLAKRLVTLTTFEWPFSCVGKNVGLKVAIGLECLLAYRTGKYCGGPAKITNGRVKKKAGVKII